MLNDKGIEHDFMPGYNLFHIYPIFPLPERQKFFTQLKINYSIKLSAEDEMITKVTR